MNKKILILGNGFIGQNLQKEFVCTMDGSLIRSFEDAQNLVDKYKPKVVINCIGITGKNNVDDCELVKDQALLANSFIPVMLAEACLRRKIKLVHISSGCIFNFDYKKDKPIKENSQDYFFGLFYSRTKIYSERALDALSKKYNILIPRIRIPLFNARHPKNILDKLLKYKKVIGLPNSVTYIPDFIKALKHLIKIDAKGIYNVVNKGVLSYPDLMRIYQKYNTSFEYSTVKFKELGIVRTNLVMSTKKLEKSGFKVRNINSVLEECVKEYLKS